MVEPKEVEAELMAAIEALRGLSPEEQEAGCLALEEDHPPEIAVRARLLLGIGERAAEITAKLDAASKPVEAAKLDAAKLDAAAKVEVAKPVEAAWPAWRRSLNPKAAAVRAAAAPIVEAAKPKPADKIAVSKPAAQRAVRKYDWTEVVIPRAAGDIEALTYVPGLVGQIVEWIVAGARRPNRVMALGVALGVVGTLIGRRVEGPTGNATHLYVFILAPTGWGKDYPLWCGNRLMIAVGAQSLLGPGEFVSGRGIIKYLKRNPLTLCIVDELGDVFQLINGQQDNPWVTDLMGHFKKLYNSWEIINTAETMKDETVAINHPAVTIVGACTAQALFEALKPRDIEGGFANRAMLLPFEGFKRPPERDVPEGAEEPPPTLVAELKQLMPPILDRKFSEMDAAPPVERAHREKIRWGSEEAKAAYFEFSREIDQWEDKSRRKFELGMRAAENAVRCATIIAAGCGSPTVDVADIGWALKWSRVSFDAADGGVEKYMRDYYEFPKFCERVLEFIRSQNGFVSERELGRQFRRNMKFGHELDKALNQLGREGHIRRTMRKRSRGPAAEGYEAVSDENPWGLGRGWGERRVSEHLCRTLSSTNLNPTPPSKVRENVTGLVSGHKVEGRKLMPNLTEGSETMEKCHQGLRGLLENLSRKPQTCPLHVTGFDA